nr:reverse transcriptase domain-containing protein [Tanacetum cinerariifolium]
MGVRRQTPPARECTYPDFMKCQPLNFKGTAGVVELTQWFEKMECVSYKQLLCGKSNQVFQLYSSWKCSNVVELPLLPEGRDKEARIRVMEFESKGYRRDRVQPTVSGTSIAVRRKIQEAIDMATELMDKKIHTFVERQTENKRKQDDNNNQAQQQPLKKQGVAIAYTAGPGERKEYAGTLTLCNKCKFHHNGQCSVKCVNCKRVGHLTRDCRSPTATNNHRNPTCYECGNQGHYRSNFLELKSQDHGNQAGGTGAHGMVHALEGGETNQDLNDVEDDINA